MRCRSRSRNSNYSTKDCEVPAERTVQGCSRVIIWPSTVQNLVLICRAWCRERHGSSALGSTGRIASDQKTCVIPKYLSSPVFRSVCFHWTQGGYSTACKSSHRSSPFDLVLSLSKVGPPESPSQLSSPPPSTLAQSMTE
jgi:hypothetical protein